MPRRIAETVLNASTMDILNVIRQNASYEYQSLVPQVTKDTDIPKVGEVLYGHPALANQFINALINRIALYRADSMTFNNPYARLKKGLLEYGETVEQIFVELAKPLEFNPEKAAAREHKRYMPDVKSAFHVMNWRVMYPITVSEDELQTAFLSLNGVQELIADIVRQVYTAAEYDEFLLFKYLLIKAVSHGKMAPIGVDMTDIKNSAKAFRGASNKMIFPSTEYNTARVRNNTPKERQAIFMDADFNAQFDVEVLASAFNMDKADFMGRLYLIDNWTSFDNERFDVIRTYSDGIEEVTADELALMADVKAVLIDETWFQIYDNKAKMTEQYTASGLYWNYFYHVWKTISTSPFHNAVVFVDNTATLTAPATVTLDVASVNESDTAKVINLELDDSTVRFNAGVDKFIQTEALTEAGVAMHPYGSIMFTLPNASLSTITIEAQIAGATYTGTLNVTSVATGDTVTLTKSE